MGEAAEILVRGTGAVGLAAALALSRQGLRVQLQGLGSGPQHADDVRAFALNAASVELLSHLRVWDALPPSARTAVHDMRVQGDAENAVLEFSAWSQSVAELAWIVDGAALEQALLSAARFSPHISWLSEGASTPAPALQVLAEGKASTTRHALGVQWRRQDYGHSAIAARLVCNQNHGGRACQWFRSPDVLALLPMDMPTPGGGYALVWSLPQAQADELMAMEPVAFEAGLQQATQAQVGALKLCSPRKAWPLQLSQASAVHGPGWVLVGDAAHVVHPLAGQGMNLGFADVAALAEVLARRETWRSLGDERLLARYARQRWLPTRAMAQVTDGLLHLFAAPHGAVRSLRNLGLSAVDKAGPLKRLLVSNALGRSELL